MLTLQELDGRVCLSADTLPDLKPFYVDFDDQAYRIKTQLSRRDPLIRCLGQGRPSVFDCTMGFCQDAFIFAHWGCQVRAVERVPEVFAVVESALQLTFLKTHNLNIYQGEAVDFIEPADVVYLDPMFPAKNKTAKAPREMQLLQAIYAAQTATATRAANKALFALASEYARKRVVVKRPDHAKPLAGRPTFSIKGKAVRFDVYLQE